MAKAQRCPECGAMWADGVSCHPVPWTIVAADVVAGGVGDYCDNVKAWARSVYEALSTSGNLPTG